MNALLQEVPAITSSPEDVFIFHSCLCPSNNANHFYPRIHYIYIQNLSGSQSATFSIEGYASKNEIPLNDIESMYDDLELCVIDEFNSFLKTKVGCTFIYWIEKGQPLILETIKSRYEELWKGQKNNHLYVIPPANRKSLQFLLNKVSQKFNADGDLKLFIKIYNNDQPLIGFLNSTEESNCFDRKEFSQISLSVISKVGFFVKLINGHSIPSKANEEKSFDRGKEKNFSPIDLQGMRVLDIIKNLNLKSTIILGSLFVGCYGVGHGIGYLTTNHEKQKVEVERDGLQKDLIAQKENISKLQGLYSDSISELKKRNTTLSELLTQKEDSLINMKK